MRRVVGNWQLFSSGTVLGLAQVGFVPKNFVLRFLQEQCLAIGTHATVCREELPPAS